MIKQKNPSVIYVNKTGHNYKIQYTWSKNENNTYSCKAEAICLNDEIHNKTETVIASYLKAKSDCTKNGLIVYTAEFENELFSAQVKTEILYAPGHKLTTYVKAKDANCTESGNSAYWCCSECGKYFSDEDAENEIEKNSWIIEAKGHSFNNNKCSLCNIVRTPDYKPATATTTTSTTTLPITTTSSSTTVSVDTIITNSISDYISIEETTTIVESTEAIITSTEIITETISSDHAITIITTSTAPSITSSTVNPEIITTNIILTSTTSLTENSVNSSTNTAINDNTSTENTIIAATTTLPQTGNNAVNNIAIVVTAILLTLSGAFMMLTFGIIRRKKENN